MYAVRRACVATFLAAGIMLGSGAAALAGGWYGDVDCGQNPHPGCELAAGGTSQTPPPPGPKPDEQPDTRPPAAKDTTPPSPPGDTVAGGDSGRADCSYVRTDYQPPADTVTTAAFRPHPARSGYAPLRSTAGKTGGMVVQAPGAGGAWYTYRCTGPGVRDGLYRAPVWIPDSQSPGAQAVSPQQLALRARAQLRLPVARMASNPAGTQLVNLPTWLWLDHGSWRPRSATASVPGISVMATATPVSVSWSMGDGTDLVCSGPGTVFPAGANPQASSPDCGHTFRRSSAGQPGQVFPVSATVHWAVTWTGAGTGGTFPDLTTTAAAAYRVAEVQALGTGNR